MSFMLKKSLNENLLTIKIKAINEYALCVRHSARYL